MLNTHYFFCNPYYERCALLWDEDRKGIIIDPGFLGEEISGFFDYVESEGIKPEAILLTHAHFDHIYGVKECIGRYNIPVYMHPDEKVVTEGAELFAADCKMPVPDVSWPTIDIHENDILTFGKISLRVIETPGHSPGSVCYYYEEGKHLFSGDCLFAGSIGNTNHRWGDYDKEIVSIMEKLMMLDGDVAVHPGHGGGTTIGHERVNNPFLEPFNYKDPETGAVDGIEFK